MEQRSPVCGWDLTIKAEGIEVEQVKVFARTHFKSWAFQLEKGDKTGYLHYQFRGSLRKKARETGIKKYLRQAELIGYPNITTVDEFEDDGDYVMKEDTRIDGPWSSKDEDEQMYIPKDMRDKIEWRPWQKGLIEIMDTPANRRTINCIINESGNIGKSWMALWLHAHGKAIYIPYFDGAKDMMRMVYGQPERGTYFVDLPKSLSHKAQNEIYAGIEMLKSGFVYEDRYKYQSKIIDPVHVFVFTNQKPDVALLSKDRWRFHYIEPDDQ